MKEDLPYFSHDNDARNHAKMKALRARFGWTGYGQFWALNEMIAGSARACLDLSRKVVRAGAACELGMTTDALESFLSFLADPDECGLIDYNEGIVTTDRTQEDYSRTETGRERKRAKGINGAEKRWNGAEYRENGVEKHSRGEESRGEENKEENIGGTSATKPSIPRFKKPTLEELAEYCIERKNTVDAQRFLDHYESNGWMVGKTKMMSWKAAVRTWEANEPKTKAKPEYKEPEATPIPPEYREMLARTYEAKT